MSVHLVTLGENELPESLSDSAHINRYYDPRNQTFAAKLLPGEYYVTQHDELLVTVVSSCVVLCLYDPVKGIGAMMHFGVPPGVDDVPREGSYGYDTIQLLIDSLLIRGASKEMLEARLFGGAVAWDMEESISQRGVRFVRRCLAKLGMTLSLEDVGGTLPRKVYFSPRSGVFYIKWLHTFTETVRNRDEHYFERLESLWCAHAA